MNRASYTFEMALTFYTFEEENYLLIELVKRKDPKLTTWFSINNINVTCHLCCNQFDIHKFNPPDLFQHGLDHLKEYNLLGFC